MALLDLQAMDTDTETSTGSFLSLLLCSPSGISTGLCL